MSQLKKVLVHENKAITAGAILTYNIPSFDTIDDIVLEFTNSGAPATLANIRSVWVGIIAKNIGTRSCSQDGFRSFIRGTIITPLR